MERREFFGQDLAEALEKASGKLGIPRDRMRYMPMDQPFGSAFKGKKIAVIVEYEPEEISSEEDDSESLDRVRAKQDQPLECSVLVLEQLLKYMEIEASVRAEQKEDFIVLTVELIGSPIDLRRGEGRELRSALQYLVNRIVYNGRENEQRFIIDIGGGLEKREDELHGLASSLASRSIRIGKTLQIQLMDSQDRRLLHIALVDDDKIETFSCGAGRYRVICIRPRSGDAEVGR
ncbi:MAG: hypothetical protein JXR96_24080 [Deltaproteobacteria bacterium]|nr:hypothetical protein [Deltaproteobacteria bacterium]